MKGTTASPRCGGWLTTLIERARTHGMDNHEIAAALEDSMVFRPLNIAKDERERLVGVLDDELTLTDLVGSSPPHLPDAERR